MSATARREQLCVAARDEFVRRGYRNATTLSVANAAGVSDALVLKYFGSKEGLFRAAVVDPLLGLLEAQMADNRARVLGGEPMDVPAAVVAVRTFLLAWADLVREERGALVSLLGDVRDFPDVAEHLGVLFREHIDHLAETLRPRAGTVLYREFDSRAATYLAIAGATLAGLVEPDTEAFIDRCVDIIMHGTLSDAGRAALP
jgi:AcrR family transcriptional regulator